ncbi:hypothetical protein Y1Q_0022400 [Alligator mississippiensis]|uniref:Uncharacterized protein n=1 Tax=Alligator mississippiensis TaxID=8496 RepID=A0A151N0H6_ALLMI|nr:hypothetical protein Y1Q_0022400 [Alligator mississippiensis]
MPSQGRHHCCCHATATWTLSSWLDPGKDADNMLLNTTTGVTLAILRLQPCCLWAHWVSQDWWLHAIQYTWDDKHWMGTFRMTQATFLDLLGQLWPYLEQQDTAMQSPLLTDT